MRNLILRFKIIWCLLFGRYTKNTSENTWNLWIAPQQVKIEIRR